MKWKKILIWIPVLCMLLLIFGFSNQNGESSGSLSRNVADSIISFAEQLNIIHPTIESREHYIEAIQFPIRKTAHMTEYAILGGLCLLAFWVDGVKKKYLFVCAFVLSVCFAAFDEFHQLFIPGRSGQFTDVGIDSIGCAIGLFVIYLFEKVFEKVRQSVDNR